MQGFGFFQMGREETIVQFDWHKKTTQRYCIFPDATAIFAKLETVW